MHICEGIETALAVSLITKNQDQVIATVNAQGMKKYRPPPKITEVFIWADNDKTGVESGMSLLKKISDKVKVKIYVPRGQGKDFLDKYLEYKTKQKV